MESQYQKQRETLSVDNENCRPKGVWNTFAYKNWKPSQDGLGMRGNTQMERLRKVVLGLRYLPSQTEEDSEARAAGFFIVNQQQLHQEGLLVPGRVNKLGTLPWKLFPEDIPTTRPVLMSFKVG